MIKLALLDVDGTLTDKTRLISTKVVETIRDVQKSGTLVSLVSGNVIPAMYALKTFVGINAPVFGENGGVMLDADVEVFFSMEKPKRFFDEITGLGMADNLMTNRWRTCSMGYYPKNGSEDEIVSLSGKRDLEIANSGFSWHILNRGQNKGYALNYLRKRYSLNLDEILVVGDSFNDIPMFLDEVKKAVPANAESRLKERADYVASVPYGEGVAEILQKASRL